MPTDDLKDGADILCICGPDGEYHPVSYVYVGDAGNVLDVDSTEVFKRDFDLQEITFDIKLTDMLDLVLILMGLDEKKIRQNNWRRLHGIPMKRRCRR